MEVWGWMPALSSNQKGDYSATPVIGKTCHGAQYIEAGGTSGRVVVTGRRSSYTDCQKEYTVPELLEGV